MTVSVPGSDNDDHSVDSADEALCEMLGISVNSIGMSGEIAEEISSTTISSQDRTDFLEFNEIETIVRQMNLSQVYENEAVCLLPRELSLPSKLMRQLTNELTYGGSRYISDRSYEKIKFIPKGGTQIEERRELTRFENFVNGHEGWNKLCNGYLANCISAICGQKMVLYKEKLNLKPPGGSGFAPHLDAPSLRVAMGREGPSTFVTVMVAIDDMTENNGCLKVCKGPWTEQNHVDIIEPEEDSNPDGGGRAGAIEREIAEQQEFGSVLCKGGDVLAFNGWAPHRSSANTSPFPRRAVFLTYNPEKEGDYHDSYYEHMRKLRDDWKNKMKMQREADHEAEMAALSSIPR